uniref:Cytochrome c domain-containing protein n=1 Tax=Schlesneria paludicola TaxID=360056 RepID=A0A7C2P230_9PLAN
MRKSATWLVCGLALAGLVVASASRQAEARPKYLGEFKGSYEKLAAEADKVKCNVCHYGTEKKNRNDYGKAVGEALGAKNVMEADKIKEGLKKAEKGKSSVEGKTFGDLINDGKLPGKAPE